MATNEILQFASQDTGSNLLTQTEYEGDAQRVIGHQPGIARSRLENKVLRQVSLMASGLAQFMAANQSGDITDGLSAQDIADALNLSVENKIASIGTGGINILQCEGYNESPAVQLDQNRGFAAEFSTAGGQTFIIGGYSYKATQSSSYTAGTLVGFPVTARITGTTKTSGIVIASNSPAPSNSAFTAYESHSYSNSTIRFVTFRGTPSTSTFTLGGEYLFVIW